MSSWAKPDFRELGLNHLNPTGSNLGEVYTSSLCCTDIRKHPFTLHTGVTYHDL